MKSRAPNRAARAAELAAINQRDVAAAQRLVDIKQAASAPAMGAASSFLNRAADQYPVPTNMLTYDISAAPWFDFPGTTPTVTGGQADPLGGTAAYLLTDDDPATTERRVFSIFAPVAGPKRFSVYQKAGTSPASRVMIRRVSDAFVWGITQTRWDAAGNASTTYSSGVGQSGRAADSFVKSGWWKLDIYLDFVDTQNLLVHLFACDNNQDAQTGTVLYFQPTLWIP